MLYESLFTGLLNQFSCFFLLVLQQNVAEGFVFHSDMKTYPLQFNATDSSPYVLPISRDVREGGGAGKSWWGHKATAHIGD